MSTDGGAGILNSSSAGENPESAAGRNATVQSGGRPGLASRRRAPVTWIGFEPSWMLSHE